MRPVRDVEALFGGALLPAALCGTARVQPGHWWGGYTVEAAPTRAAPVGTTVAPQSTTARPAATPGTTTVRPTATPVGTTVAPWTTTVRPTATPAAVPHAATGPSSTAGPPAATIVIVVVCAAVVIAVTAAVIIWVARSQRASPGVRFDERFDEDNDDVLQLTAVPPAHAEQA
jgi:hypothetical protein